MNYPLDSAFTFSTLPHHEKIKLIVFKNHLEYVCRIENKKKLNQFLTSKDAILFKGRLQLIKKQEEIFIQVKGTIIGTISTCVFKDLLQTQRTL